MSIQDDRLAQLDPDAAPVPDGLMPREGVEYGCGQPCIHCYEPAADTMSYRVHSQLHGEETASTIVSATSPDEARTMVERAHAGVEDIEIVSVECID